RREPHGPARRTCSIRWGDRNRSRDRSGSQSTSKKPLEPAEGVVVALARARIRDAEPHRGRAKGKAIEKAGLDERATFAVVERIERASDQLLALPPTSLLAGRRIGSRDLGFAGARMAGARTSATAEPDERAFGRATFPRRAGLDVVEADAAHETRDPATQDGRRLLSGRLLGDAAIAGRKRGVGRRLLSSAARAFELADALPGPELRLLKKVGDALVRAVGIGEAARHVPHGGLEQVEKARHRVVITGLRAAQKLADVVA